VDEIKKKAKRSWKRLLTLCGVIGIGLIATLLSKDSIIIYLGIGAYKVLRSILIGALALSAVGSAGSGIRLAGQIRQQITSDRERQQIIEDKQRQEPPRLSVKDKLENAYLRELLKKHMQNQWSNLTESITKCTSQLEQMDEYQDKLSRLLKNNGADMLYDTEDVLDRVEQYICRNVRKVLNYMEVADSRLPADSDMVKSKLADCWESNQEQLRQTQEFIFALTDFLNQQGDSENDATMLELYKKTILDSIKE